MESSSLSVFTLLFPLFLSFNVGHSHSFNTTIQTMCHKRERDALLELKSDLYSESCIPGNPFDSYWADLKTWTFGGKNGDCCNWDGVECDEHSGHVIGLYLNSSCLSGAITSTSSIFKLDHLQNLDLSWNDFRYSKIPSAICNLSRLENLILYAANFSGQIPSEILHLTNLSSLELGGCIPMNPNGSTLMNPIGSIFMNPRGLTLKNPSLGDLVQSLVKLEHLWLLFVEISSTIPDSLFRLTSLRYLGLPGCKMHGQIPPSLANLTKLKVISLPENQFTGEIFPQLVRLPKLMRVFLPFNKFSGQIPRTIFHLKNLQVLSLALNNFSGKYPLLNQNLEFLDLSFNQLTGSLPVPSTNSSLQYYLVSNNQFSGELPTRVCDLVDLKILDIGNNNLSGMVPQCLNDMVGMGNLSVLDLHNNSFSGPIPPVGKNRCNLVMIDMSYNQLGGQVPSDMENCIDLEFLNLGNNKIIDLFPFWLGKLLKLSVLILRTNRFHGIIEEPLGGYMFPKLKIMDSSNNYFTGRLPAQYFEGWRAMEVDVDKEDRTTSYASYRTKIYAHFYSMILTNKGISIEYTEIQRSLLGVDLSSNYFTGEIPKSIATLKGLYFLNLSHNMLTGSIPFDLNGLTNLESLDLSHNKLSGEIPQQLTDLTMLECFDVSFNQLTGLIPQSKQFNTFEDSSYEGNLGLCGLPLSKKCRNIIDASPPSSLEKDRASRTWFEIDWKIISMGYTSGFVIGAIMGMNWTRGCKKVKRVCQIKFLLN